MCYCYVMSFETAQRNKSMMKVLVSSPVSEEKEEKKREWNCKCGNTRGSKHCVYCAKSRAPLSDSDSDSSDSDSSDECISSLSADEKKQEPSDTEIKVFYSFRSLSLSFSLYVCVCYSISLCVCVCVTVSVCCILNLSLVPSAQETTNIQIYTMYCSGL